MKKSNTTKQKPAARENATAFIHLKIKPSELAALKLAAGKQPFGAWVREACQAAAADGHDVRNMARELARAVMHSKPTVCGFERGAYAEALLNRLEK